MTKPQMAHSWDRQPGWYHNRPECTVPVILEGAIVHVAINARVEKKAGEEQWTCDTCGKFLIEEGNL